jgi:hypothetical protein
MPTWPWHSSHGSNVQLATSFIITGVTAFAFFSQATLTLGRVYQIE